MVHVITMMFPFHSYSMLLAHSSDSFHSQTVAGVSTHYAAPNCTHNWILSVARLTIGVLSARYEQKKTSCIIPFLILINIHFHFD